MRKKGKKGRKAGGKGEEEIREGKNKRTYKRRGGGGWGEGKKERVIGGKSGLCQG